MTNVFRKLHFHNNNFLVRLKNIFMDIIKRMKLTIRLVKKYRSFFFPPYFCLCVRRFVIISALRMVNIDISFYFQYKVCGRH